MRILTVSIVCGVLLSAQGLRAAAGEGSAEKEIMATLEAMAAATIQRDVPTLDRIYHDDLTYNHSTGMSQNKAQIMRAVPQGSFTLMKFSDPLIHLYGDIAVVKVTTDLRYYPGGVVADRHLNQMFVLQKSAQGWRIVAKHTTRILAEVSAAPSK